MLTTRLWILLINCTSRLFYCCAWAKSTRTISPERWRRRRSGSRLSRLKWNIQVGAKRFRFTFTPPSLTIIINNRKTMPICSEVVCVKQIWVILYKDWYLIEACHNNPLVRLPAIFRRTFDVPRTILMI